MSEKFLMNDQESKETKMNATSVTTTPVGGIHEQDNDDTLGNHNQKHLPFLNKTLHGLMQP